jgi:hypothetical protein
MSFIRGTPRQQALLFPDLIDDYLSEDNSVRFIDAFVDDLSLEALGWAAFKPQAGKGMYKESRSDVAIEEVKAGLQNNHRLSQRQPQGV